MAKPAPDNCVPWGSGANSRSNLRRIRSLRSPRAPRSGLRGRPAPGAAAQLNTAVKDGVASFFFHPYVDVSYLKTTVEGVQGAGYTFVPASSM